MKIVKYQKKRKFVSKKIHNICTYKYICIHSLHACTYKYIFMHIFVYLYFVCFVFLDIIAVGSDGIWDCWKWDDFSDYVNGMMTKYDNNLSKTTVEVLRHTVQRAKACFGVKSYDDASLVFISLRSQMFDDVNNVNNVSCLAPSEFTISSSSNNSSASTDSMFSQQQQNSNSNISVLTDVTVGSSGSGNVQNTNNVHAVSKVKSEEASEVRGLDDSD